MYADLMDQLRQKLSFQEMSIISADKGSGLSLFHTRIYIPYTPKARKTWNRHRQISTSSL